MPVRIAVASGKGGTGKTTVATNLYRSINRNNASRALLMDCDLVLTRLVFVQVSESL
ncbi:MAG: P-loop NTPase, partial [Bacteroidales bacterium]|nr:P-loop NTPase [Bacteroidales bacterium]